VRPTLARVRSAIFDRLQDEVVGSRVLDLFSGTGALAIEALSRGAAEATLVEVQPTLVRFLRHQLEALDLEEVAVVRQADVFPYLARAAEKRGPFDLVLADPPYADATALERIARALTQGRWLAPQAVLVCEQSRVGARAVPALWPAALVLEATRVHGQTILYYLRFQCDPSPL
jgi:16S rRNA (guanine966-N2)-methyltransferase